MQFIEWILMWFIEKISKWDHSNAIIIKINATFASTSADIYEKINKPVLIMNCRIQIFVRALMHLIILQGW